MGGRTKDRILDLGTGLVLALALALVVEARVLPLWRASQVVEVGERMPRDPGFLALGTGEPVALGHGVPTLLLVFRSDCPACGRLAPTWRALAGELRPGGRALAVALEPPGPALAYVRRRLAPALAVRPEERERFLRIADVRAVPTTLWVDGDRRLRFRHTGELAGRDLAALRELAASTLPSSDRR